jgi:hypothetical protein
VVILEGPFQGLVGILQDQTGEERVLVLLRIFGEGSSAALPLSGLRPAGKTPNISNPYARHLACFVGR